MFVTALVGAMLTLLYGRPQVALVNCHARPAGFPILHYNHEVTLVALGIIVAKFCGN